MEQWGKWNFIGYNMFNCPNCGTPYTLDEFKYIQRYKAEFYFPDYCPECGENMKEDEIRLKWIPCSEKLPERDDPVLVTYKGNMVGKAFCDDGRWRTVNTKELSTVVAWMPLPEPYRGQ